jgi:hypothetical protein
MSLDDRERLVAEYLQPLGEVEPVVRRSPEAARPRRPGRVVVALGLAALLGLAVVAIAIRRPTSHTPSRPAVRPLTRDRVIASPWGVSIRPWGQTTPRSIVTGDIASWQFSPDGTALAFIAIQSNHCSLYLLSFADTGIRRLGTCPLQESPVPAMPLERTAVYGGTAFTINGEAIAGPTWSPDSRRLAWLCQEGASPIDGSFCIADRQGGLVKLAVVGASWPVWSPDGATIAYLTDVWSVRHSGDPNDLEAWLMAPDGSNRRRASSRGQACCIGAHSYLGWSHDSSKLLVLGTRAQVIDVASRKSTFYKY